MGLPMFYDEADEWSRTLLLYDAAIKEVTTKLEILKKEFRLNQSYNPIEYITSRIKSAESIARKMQDADIEITVENIIEHVNDLAGVRVICPFTSDIYRIVRALEQQDDIHILKIKDYIEHPKENGYMSYHMITKVPVYLSERKVDTKVEIQIRTIAMDFWASLEHKIYYKFQGNAPSGIRAELKECANIISFLDRKMLSLNEYVHSYMEEKLEEKDVVKDESGNDERF